MARAKRIRTEETQLLPRQETPRQPPPPVGRKDSGPPGPKRVPTSETAPPFPRDAMHFFLRKKIMPHPSVNASWAFEHAAAFRIAKETRRDVLKDIQAGLASALAEGKTFQQFAKELRPMLAKAGWWPERDAKGKLMKKPPYRLQKVFETNLRMARAASQEERILRQQNIFPYLVYELGPSARHRPEHQAWAGTMLPVNDPWWDAHMPMNAWGCKCSVRQVSRGEAFKLGGPTERPPYQPVEMVNKQTGEITTVDKGIHPDFNGRPSKLREKSLIGKG